MRLIKLEQYNCAPCNSVSTFLDSKQVKYQAINVMDNPEVASEYSVMSVPVTILLDDNGNEVKRSVGFKPAELDQIIGQL